MQKNKKTIILRSFVLVAISLLLGCNATTPDTTSAIAQGITQGLMGTSTTTPTPQPNTTTGSSSAFKKSSSSSFGGAPKPAPNPNPFGSANTYASAPTPQPVAPVPQPQPGGFGAVGINPDYFYALSNGYFGDGVYLTSPGTWQPLYMSNSGVYTEWALELIVGNTYFISAMDDQGSLEASADATSVIVSEWQPDNPYQQWQVSNAGNGYYRITNVGLGGGYGLDVYTDGSAAAMNPVDSQGQYWLLSPATLRP